MWRILKGAGIRAVKIVVVDLSGRPRGVTLDVDYAKEALTDGITLDGSSIPAYAEVSASDVTAKPDLSSVYIEPYGKSALVFSYVAEPREAASRDPRLLLRSVYGQLLDRGYTVRVGIELEFFLVRRREGKILPADSGGYFDVSTAGTSIRIVEELERAAYRSGLGHSKIHHEVAPGQYEYNVSLGPPLRVADSMLFVKELAARTACRHGLRATFMPKPFWGLNGSGAHIHVSVYDRDGRNLVGGKTLSGVGLSLVAALLKHARVLSVFAASTVNSYKRLVPGHEAPTRIAWGYGNRSTLVRVPVYGGRVSTVEYRQPDPLMNPHLCLAAILAAAARGIEEELEPPPPATGKAYDLKEAAETPRNLGEAVELASAAHTGLGLPKEILELYLGLKKAEWEEYLDREGAWERTWNTITEWEYGRYL